jgi:hypothetical protein
LTESPRSNSRKLSELGPWLQHSGERSASRADFGASPKSLFKKKTLQASSRSRGNVEAASSRFYFSLNNAGFSQRVVGAVLVDCLQAARGHADADEFFQFRNPNSVFVQVWPKNARHIFGDVSPDAPLFLGHTAAMNHAPARGS